MSSKQETIFDKRVVKRNIKRKILAENDYEHYIKNLKDATHKAVPIFSEEEARAAERKNRANRPTDG